MQGDQNAGRPEMQGDEVGDLHGLTALVTGGASGIGLATVEQLARAGASVVVLDLARTAETRSVISLECDVADDRRVRTAVADAAGRLGGIDIVVNSAGIGAAGTIEANDDPEWHRVYDINVVGTVRVTRAALPWLRRSANAAVVNVCSIAATAGLPQRALYSATKGAVFALTLAMAADHLRERIRVNCVNPGTADTPWVQRLLAAAEDPEAERAALEARQPTGRLVPPADIAAAITYLAGPSARSVTGASLGVDGGMQGLRLPR